MGLIDRIKRRLPMLGGAPTPAKPLPVSRPRSPLPMAQATEEAEPESPRGSQPVHAYIESVVKGHPVVLFMKGSPGAPQCGFSASAVGILQGYSVPLHHVDVLADPEVRDGVKAFSNWPTIPQVFIGGAFVGGADILKQLHQSGELRTSIEALTVAS